MQFLTLKKGKLFLSIPSKINKTIPILITAFLLTNLYSRVSNGQTLNEALTQAYLNNPVLAAARSELQAVNQKIPQALSGWQPNIAVTGSIGRRYQVIDSAIGNSNKINTYPWQAEITVVQPLYRGGRTIAATKQAKNLVSAQQASFKATEQNILLETVSAYMDVVRDQAILSLTKSNEQVIGRQLAASQDRFKVGEITRTDVALSESRLSGATAQRIRAEGNLAISKAAFVRVVGVDPKNLRSPLVPTNLPKTQEEILQAAANNPAVLLSAYLEKAARDGIDLSFGELLPTVSLIGSYSIEENNFRHDNRNTRLKTGTIMAQISIPLYQAGLPQSRLRESKLIANQRQQELRAQQEFAIQSAISSWQELISVRAQAKAYESQVHASKIALEGIRQEAAVGSRTLLDSLDAEQEYLDAQVSLVITKRDEIVAAYRVLAAMGKLSLDDLSLPIK